VRLDGSEVGASGRVAIGGSVSSVQVSKVAASGRDGAIDAHKTPTNGNSITAVVNLIPTG
jgi:hypothetical protein